MTQNGLRYAFYIDGINLHYALNNCKRESSIPRPKQYSEYDYFYRKYRWLDFYELANKAVYKSDTIVCIKYFTASPDWKPQARDDQRELIRANRYKSDKFSVIQGSFVDKDSICDHCKRELKSHEEKGTDVELGLQLLLDAQKDIYDIGVVISADSDLAPALRFVHEETEKKVGVIIPIGRRAGALLKKAKFPLKGNEPIPVINMTEALLKKCQLPDSFSIKGQTFSRPHDWV